jgi:two-component sensor histidine kinase
MNIIQSFLLHALQVPQADLRSTLERAFAKSEFSASLQHRIDALLRAEDQLRDDLWKVSLSLELPHQLLFDAFLLQQQVSHIFESRLKVG